MHTTCLSETIGDDIPQIIGKARDEGKIPAGKFVIHANTPSYVGSHVTGFANMVRGMVDYFAEPAEAKTAAVNLVPGWVEPADMREIKRLAGDAGRRDDRLPRHVRRAGRPADRQARVLSRRAARPSTHLRRTGASQATIALGPTASEAAARQLETKFEVPARVLELPIGLRATDRFINALRKVARVAGAAPRSPTSAAG